MSEFDLNTIIITRETTKRLLKDIKDIIKSPLENEGIYYKHDENNILKGYAYICGPEDSVYFGGNYFFTFDFPSNYPYKPPMVTFKTNDGVTRFHPNLYKSGKVCLSILNTWKGEQWSGCQSIRTVLLTILTIMDNKPLLHEPGIREGVPEIQKYNNIIQFKNIDFTINNILLKNSGWSIEPFVNIFRNEIKNQLFKNKDKLLKIILENKFEEKYIEKCSYYNMKITIDWKWCEKIFNEITEINYLDS